MTTLAGSVVFVTGANGGLGAEFVAQALERGASRVYATARAPRAWDDPRVVPLALDVTDATSIAAAAVAAPDVTVLVNNAGIMGPGGRLLDAPLGEVRAVIETNAIAPLALIQAFAPVLAHHGGGAMIDVHSALSWLATGAYSASKAAFWSLTNALRVELHSQGTQVLGAHLGYTDTPMTAAIDASKGRADDVVRAIYDGLESGEVEVLADDSSRWVKSALSGPVLALYPQLAVER